MPFNESHVTTYVTEGQLGGWPILYVTDFTGRAAGI